MKHVDPTKLNTSGLTLTVAELIAELRRYDPELPVIAEWERVGAGFRPDNFRVSEYEGRKELIINVDDHG